MPRGSDAAWLTNCPELSERPNLLAAMRWHHSLRKLVMRSVNDMENILKIPDPLVAGKVLGLWWHELRYRVHESWRPRLDAQCERSVFPELYGTLRNVYRNGRLRLSPRGSEGKLGEFDHERPRRERDEFRDALRAEEDRAVEVLRSIGYAINPTPEVAARREVSA